MFFVKKKININTLDLNKLVRSEFKMINDDYLTKNKFIKNG